MAMGLLRDIRSGKRDPVGTGGDAILFWFLAGLVLAVVTGYGVGASEKSMLILAAAGATVGLCLGFYAAFGATRLAWALALPGALIALLH
jgi:hypothetical protein